MAFECFAKRQEPFTAAVQGCHGFAFPEVVLMLSFTVGVMRALYLSRAGGLFHRMSLCYSNKGRVLEDFLLPVDHELLSSSQG